MPDSALKNADRPVGRGPQAMTKEHPDNYVIIQELRAEIDRLTAQVSRDDEHYQAAMTMAEKYRKNWVEVCQEREQLRAELAIVIKRTGYHLLRPTRDLTVTRVDDQGVAYNAAGDAIGMTGKTGCGGHKP